MRITKAWLRDTRRRLVESQARFCAIAAAGRPALEAEHKRLFPHYVGPMPEGDYELLRQLLYHDLTLAIPDVLAGY